LDRVQPVRKARYREGREAENAFTRETCHNGDRKKKKRGEGGAGRRADATDILSAEAQSEGETR